MSVYFEMKDRKYGMLTVVEVRREKRCYPSGECYVYYADCLCDCGNSHTAACSAIKHSKTTSCGCRRDQYQKLSGKNSSRFNGYEGITGRLYNTIKHNAIRRGIRLSVNKKFLWELYLQQNKLCALTGLPISFSHVLKDCTASLDRVDSSKGYLKGNVQWVHKKINTMKHTLSQEEFVKLCVLVAQNVT